MQSPSSLKPAALAAIVALTLNGCVTTNPQNQNGQSSIDDPCANDNARNIAMAAGALLGGILGNQVVKGNNRSLATIFGAGFGGALGAFIGAEIDKRQCGLSKIQKKHELDMQVTPITMEAKATQSASSEATNSTPAQGGATSTHAEAATQQNVGLSVSVVDRESKPQFMSGSDGLQPEAKEQFSEIARLYATDQVVAGMGEKSNDERQKLSDELSKKRMLLIGHTDDTGSSKLNADLSERRAKAVAQVFKSMGVAEAQLFYQGAGETLPIADNATQEGRSKNRRVEIVDLSNEETFKLYLQNRRPNTAYYRPVDTENKPTQAIDKPVQTASAPEAKPAKTTATVKNKTKVVSANKTGKTSDAVATTDPALTPKFIDFGGSPFTMANATVDIGEVTKSGSRFTLINEAHADAGPILSCNRDRPRNAGEVKSLKDGKIYATNEYLPGVYDSSWAGQANGHLVALTHVAVLRDGAVPARKPELMVYQDFKGDKQAKPAYNGSAEVNAYRGDKALLYRVFSDGPISCMDVIIPNSTPMEAPNSSIFYAHNNTLYSTTFNAKIAK